jgi:hypothetical protein
MIDAYWISFAIVMAGAFTRMGLPYLMKCMEDPDTKFKLSYLYSLLIPAFIGALALIPAEIAPSPQYYVALFAAGLGVESVVADGITKRAKLKEGK